MRWLTRLFDFRPTRTATHRDRWPTPGQFTPGATRDHTRPCPRCRVGRGEACRYHYPKRGRARVEGITHAHVEGHR